MLDRTAKTLLTSLAGAALALAGAGALPASAAANPATVTVYDSLAQLRPDRSLPAGGSQQADLSAARNEAESFQVLIQAGQSGNPGLRVEAGAPLSGPGGAHLPADAISIYREDYYRVTQRSDAEGGVGAWPDALIPETDSFYGEDRSAFPVDAPAGGQVAVWVDVLVPVGQPAGEYSGSLLVSDSGGQVAAVSVDLTVEGFSLPSTSSLESAFFASSGEICAALTGSSSCESAAQAWQSSALFARAALNNRVTIANAYAGSPDSPYFDRYFAPLLSGTDSGVQLPGARLTSVEVYGPSCGSGSCLGPWKDAAQRYGFGDRFFYYACDEPQSGSDWNQCKQNAQSAEAQWPGVRALVTAPLEDSATSYVDTFAPLINDISPPAGNQRPEYDDFLAGAGKKLWLYTSCRSYSCDSSEGSAYDGWPGYAIDEPASQARAMGWLTFLYRVSGELYYNTTQSLTTAATDQYASGGNGDGNLFYAGTPGGGSGRIGVGGSHPIPVESIRLKRIRDGREDFEYLRELASHGKRSEAMDIAREVFGAESEAGRSATVGSGALSAARGRLAAAIEGRSGSGAGRPEPPAPSGPAPAPGSPPPVAPSPAGVAGGGGAPITLPSSVEPSLRLTVVRIEVPRRASRLGRRGVRALVSCTAACRVRLDFKVSRGVARRLGLGTRRIGRGSARLGADRRRWISASPTRSARRRLRRADRVWFRLRADARVSPAGA